MKSEKLWFIIFQWRYTSTYILYFTFFFTQNYFCQQNINFAGGTAIIAYLENDTIWVGADSRQTFNTGSFTDNGCKIINWDSIVVATAGVAFNKNKGFDIQKIVKINLAQNTLIPFQELGVISRIYEQFNQWLHTEKLTNIVLDSLAVEILFAYAQEGKPTISSNRFVPYVDSRGNGSVHFAQKKPAKVKDNSVIYYAGIYDRIEEIVSSGIFYTSADKPYIIEQLIKAQAMVNNKVGGDIDIIMITKEGTKWIKKKKICN